MTRISLLGMASTVVLALSLAVPALAGELTTRDLVELHRAGLGEEVLVALVESDGGPFHLSPAELVDLKAEGLSDRVLAAMIRTGRGPMVADPGYAVMSSECQPHALLPVPVPVVPVPVRRGFGGYGGGYAAPPIDDGMWDVGPSLGHVPVPHSRPQPTTTVDAIRHAPPGFHPGTIGPRDGSSSRVASRPSPRTPAATAPTSPAVQAAPSRSTPGVARSPAAGEPRPSTPGVARSSSGRSAGS